MSNFLFWSRDSADTAAIAKALAATAAASPSSPRLVTQGPVIEELPRAREDNPNALSGRGSEVPTINWADLRSSLPGPRPSSSVSSGGSFPASANALRQNQIRPSSAPISRLFSAVRRSAARPSSAPSSNRSRSRSRTRPVLPVLLHDVGSTAAAPSATVLPATAQTFVGSAAATAVPVAAAANPYPINPMFPDNSAGAASSFSNACNMASASCYPFVSQFASFTPAASMPSRPAHVANACNVNPTQALMQPPVIASAGASAPVPPTVGHVKHHGVSELTTGLSFQLDSVRTPATPHIPQNLRTTAKRIPSPPPASGPAFGLAAPAPPPPPSPCPPAFGYNPCIPCGAQQPKTPPKVTPIGHAPPPPPPPKVSVPAAADSASIVVAKPAVPKLDAVDLSLPASSAQPLVSRDGRPVRESAMINPVQFSASAAAVSSGDPQAVNLVLEAKKGMLTESNMNRLLDEDSLQSELADHWSLPEAQGLKYFQGRAAWLAAETLRWPLVDRDEFTSCVAYFLRLVHRPPNAQNSFDIQQDVLLTFCQSIVCAGFPYRVAFVTPGQSWVHNNKVIWELETSAFPGPLVRAKSGSDSVYRWFHGTTQSSLLGIMKCGRMLRTCNETVGLRSDQTAYGFFGRACYESDRRAMAQIWLQH